MGEKKSRIQALFADAEFTKDGSMPKDELQKLFVHMGMSADDVKDILTAIDKDSDFIAVPALMDRVFGSDAEALKEEESTMDEKAESSGASEERAAIKTTSEVPAELKKEEAMSKSTTVPITDSNRKVVGHAPHAPRPEWLPKGGKGQANVPPLCWSISVEQWVFFLRSCVDTDTWKALVKAKGEYNITMYDINDHFVKPWTEGTGCSIALLMNDKEQLPVEGMLSHAWAGSVVETYNCLQNMVNHKGVPSTSRFFYCVFSLYQPQDNAPGGLSIQEQIDKEPFAQIIESQPTHGMFIVHTTTCEVYERLWVAHEADVCINAKLKRQGLFDMYRWTTEQFQQAAAIKTANGQVGSDADRSYIEGLIMKRGGYEHLDKVIGELIADFRKDMQAELEELLKPQDIKEDDYYFGLSIEDDTDKRLDWCRYEREDYDCIDEEYERYHFSISWAFASQWQGILRQMRSRYGMGPLPDYVATKKGENDKMRMHKFAFKEQMKQLEFDQQTKDDHFAKHLGSSMSAHPLGKSSYPFGPPESKNMKSATLF